MKFQILLFSLYTLVQASPNPNPSVRDVHSTKVAVFSMDSDNATADQPSHFAVTVDRMDSLIDDSFGDDEVIAAKRIQVVLKFDIDAAGVLTMNDANVPMGISKIDVDAKTWAGASEDTEVTAELVNQFDVGLVSVEVHAKAYELVRADYTVRRFVISERILEVNGDIVQQSVLVQQVLELLPNGNVLRGIPHTAEDLIDSDLGQDIEVLRNSFSDAQEQEAAAADENTFDSESDCAMSWIASLPVWAKYVLLFVESLVITAIGYALLRICMQIGKIAMDAIRARGYTPLEKNAFSQNDIEAGDALPEYENKIVA